MTFPSFNLPLVAIAILVVGAPLGGAETAAPAAARTAPTNAAKEKAQVSTAARAELQKKANDQRDTMIAEHEALAKQLKDATEAQKKEILAKMQEQKKKFEEVIGALHRQMREEIRERRQSSGPGKK